MFTSGLFAWGGRSFAADLTKAVWPRLRVETGESLGLWVTGSRFMGTARLDWRAGLT